MEPNELDSLADCLERTEVELHIISKVAQNAVTMPREKQVEALSLIRKCERDEQQARYENDMAKLDYARALSNCSARNRMKREAQQMIAHIETKQELAKLTGDNLKKGAACLKRMAKQTPKQKLLDGAESTLGKHDKVLGRLDDAGALLEEMGEPLKTLDTHLSDSEDHDNASNFYASLKSQVLTKNLEGIQLVSCKPNIRAPVFDELTELPSPPDDNPLCPS